MSLRADMYRRKAAEAKQSASQAENPSMKRALEDMAIQWVRLAEQVEWIDNQKASVLKKKNGGPRGSEWPYNSRRQLLGPPTKRDLLMLGSC
jgi:hypothetical protein